jgi:hypothetical protein
MGKLRGVDVYASFTTKTHLDTVVAGRVVCSIIYNSDVATKFSTFRDVSPGSQPCSMRGGKTKVFAASFFQVNTLGLDGRVSIEFEYTLLDRFLIITDNCSDFIYQVDRLRHSLNRGLFLSYCRRIPFP